MMDGSNVHEVRPPPSQDHSSSEDDMEWLLATARSFLSGIKDKIRSDATHQKEEEGDVQPVPKMKRVVAQVVPTMGSLDWRPAPVETVAFSSGKGCLLSLTSFNGYRVGSAPRRRQPSVDSTTSFLCPIKMTSMGGTAITRATSYAHLLGGSESDVSISDGSSTPQDHDHSAGSVDSASSTSSDHFTSTEEETSEDESVASGSSVSSTPPYDPYFLDDPELRTGKHKTVIALPGYLGSVSHFIRAEELKRELNEQFRQIHPGIDPSLTLSKIRKLKLALIKVSEQLDLELSTVAKAFTFFEKLVLKNLVNKTNRKLVGAACLFLAMKSNDDDKREPADYTVLYRSLAEHLDITRSELIWAEFPVYAALEFDLMLEPPDFMAHLDRILTGLDYSNLQEYLGERMYSVWKRDVT